MYYEIFERLLKERGITSAQVSRDTGIPKSTLSSWKAGGARSLSSGNMQKIADYFGVSVDYLMTGDPDAGHYEDPLTAELAEKMKDDHDLRLLFSAARDARPETLQAVYDVLVALKKREKGEE